MNKTYERIKEAKALGLKLSEAHFSPAQVAVCNAIRKEARMIMGMHENALCDDGDFATEVPTADTLAHELYRAIILGEFENEECYFILAEHKHARFFTKEFLDGVCQWYAEKAVEQFDDYGRKYKTY